MRFDESKRTRLPMTMRPRSGRTVPAMAFTRVVLPEPDRPKSATMGASLSNAASTRKSPRRTETSTSSIGGPAMATNHPLGKSERGERHQHRDDREAQCLRVAVRHLGRGVDRERQRARLAGNVGDEGYRRAELSQRAREGE